MSNDSSHIQQMESVLRTNLQPQSNEMRAKAESQLMELKRTNPTMFFTGLSELMIKSNDAGIRAFSAVVFRRDIRISEDAFDNVSTEARECVQKNVLRGIVSEPDRNVRVKIADVVGALACRVLPRAAWPDLQPVLIQLTQANDPIGREAFLVALERVSLFAPEILHEHMTDVRTAVVQSLQDEFPPVRVAAMRACVSMLRAVDSLDELGSFRDIVSVMFNCLSAGGNDTVVAAQCEQLQTLVDRRVELFDENFGPILQCLLGLVKCGELSWGTRRQAMNLIVAMTEQCTKYDALPVAREVIPLGFAFMDQFDESIDWNSPADDTEQDNFVFGGQCLARLVEVLGEDDFLSVAQPLLERNFSSSDWKPRLVGLGVVRNVAMFCVQSWGENLDSVVQVAGSSLGSDHPYVRYMALSVLQELCVAFGNTDEDDQPELPQGFHAQYHKSIVAAVVKMMSEEKHRCVVSQTCELITHFCYTCPLELLGSFAQVLLERLLVLLQQNDPLIQASACKSVSIIACVCENHFGTFYQTFIDAGRHLLGMGVNPKSSEEMFDLRGKAMEMVGAVIAASPEMSKKDGHAVMQVMLPQTRHEREMGLISYNYMMRLYSTICRVLGGGFCQYLDGIIPLLIESSKLQPTGTFAADDPQAPSENATNIISATVRGSMLGERKICINTDAIQEKMCAVDQLAVYAEVLEGDFFPYVEQVFIALKNCCSSASFSDVRLSALEAMPLLVHCYIDGLQKQGQNGRVQSREMVLTVMALLVKAVTIEQDVNGMVMIFGALCEIIEESEQQLPEELVGEMAEQIAQSLCDRQFRHTREDSTESMDVDSVTEGVECAFADQVTDLVRVVAKCGQEAFVQHFDNTISKICVQFLAENASVEDRLLGLSVFTEVVGNGGSSARRYGQDLLNVCQMCLVDADTGLRQQAAFTIGVCAQANVMVNADAFLGKLKQLIDNPQSRNEENIGVTENCVSAIGKICRYHGDKCDVNNIFPTWLEMLPIVDDNEERESCNDYLLQQLQGSFKDVVMSNEKVMVQILKIIGHAVLNDDSHSKQFGQFFAFVAQQNKDMVQKCFESGFLEQKMVVALTGSLSGSGNNGTCA